MDSNKTLFFSQSLIFNSFRVFFVLEIVLSMHDLCVCVCYHAKPTRINYKSVVSIRFNGWMSIFILCVSFKLYT